MPLSVWWGLAILLGVLLVFAAWRLSQRSSSSHNIYHFRKVNIRSPISETESNDEAPLPPPSTSPEQLLLRRRSSVEQDAQGEPEPPPNSDIPSVPRRKRQWVWAFKPSQAGTARVAKTILSVFVGTWNLNDSPPPRDLSPWIPKPSGKSTDYDIVAIGAQECNYKPRGTNRSCEQDWFGVIQSHLGEGYITIATVSLRNSIRLIILAKREHEDKISGVEITSESTTVPIFWRKGGCAIAFRFLETSLCFVNCHLTAHQNNVAERNTDVRKLFESLRVGLRSLDLSAQFHHLFWVGDFNYRIDLSRDECFDLIRLGRWQSLQQEDQLLKERRAGRLFSGFSEGELLFPPTYKYEKVLSRSVSENFDISATESASPTILHSASTPAITNSPRDVIPPTPRSPRTPRQYTREKNRIPAWCDRILYRSLPHCGIVQNSYTSADAIDTSDHVPVSATFSAEVVALYPAPSINAKSYRLVVTDLSSTGLRHPNTIGLGTADAIADLIVATMPAAAGLYPKIVFYTPAGILAAETNSAIGTQAVQDSRVSTAVSEYGVWAAPFTLVTRPITWDFLLQQHLLLEVRNVPPGNYTGESIGNGAVSLSELTWRNPMPFTCTVFFRGIEVGALSGMLAAEITSGDISPRAATAVATAVARRSPSTEAAAVES